MADEIARIVEGYMGRAVSISEAMINSRVHEAEFNGRFRQVISNDVRVKLEKDVRQLAIQGLLLGSKRATYEQAVSAISAELDGLMINARDVYIKLRLGELGKEEAFKESTREISELIQAVQLEFVSEDFYLMAERQLGLNVEQAVYR